MKEQPDLSSAASRLLDLAREVPALDSERRAQMKRAVLASAPSDPARSDSAMPGSPVVRSFVGALRAPILSAVVVALVAAITVPWAISAAEDGDALGASTTSPAGTPPLASPPDPAISHSGAAPPPSPTSPISNPPPPPAPEVLTVESPHALGSLKRPGSEHRRTMGPRAPAPIDDKSLVASPASSTAPIVSPLPSPSPSPESAAPAASSSLQEEVRLVRGADRAVSARDPNRALELLDEHERRFPRGTLASEREMLVVLALCAAGRDADAAEHATRFRERHPHSPLLDRLQHSCARGSRP